MSSFYGFRVCVFFFTVAATTEIYTLSLHDALPICPSEPGARRPGPSEPGARRPGPARRIPRRPGRSEEHTSELQSRRDLVCRLLLEKKKYGRVVDAIRSIRLQAVRCTRCVDARWSL